jgi:adenosylcobinamide-phosphate synthase
MGIGKPERGWESIDLLRAVALFFGVYLLFQFLWVIRSILIIAIVSPVVGSPVLAVKTALRDGRKPPSINSGYPMAAFAGALGIRMEKLKYYVLGAGLRPCVPDDIPRAIRLNRAASALLIIIVVAVLLLFSLPLTWGVSGWPTVW